MSVGATTGRAGIIFDCPLAIVRSVLLLKTLSDVRFMLNWIRTIWCQKWISKASGASAQAHLYINDTKAMPIPLLSEPEQKEIVCRIESLFKLADAIQNRQSKIQNQIETLNQSILAKAFRGELVPQDSNDEPASVLLEKIKEERDKAKATAKKKSSKKKDKQLGIPGM